MNSKRDAISCHIKVRPRDYTINEIPLYKTNEIDNYDSLSNTISESTSVITFFENIKKPLKELSYPYFVEEDLDQEMSNRCQNPIFNKSFENSNNDSNYIEYWSPETTSKNVPLGCTRLSGFASYENNRTGLNGFENLNEYNNGPDSPKNKQFCHVQIMSNKFNDKPSNPTILGRSFIKVLPTSNTEHAHNIKSMSPKKLFKKRVNLSPNRSTIMSTNYSLDYKYDVTELDNQQLLSAKCNPIQSYLSKPTDTADSNHHIHRNKNFINKTEKHFEFPQGIARVSKSSPFNVNHHPPTKRSSITIAKFTLHENDKGIFVPFSWLGKIETEEVKLKIIRKELSMIPKPTTKGNKFYKSRHSTLVCKIATPHRVMTHLNLPVESY